MKVGHEFRKTKALENATANVEHDAQQTFKTQQCF